MLMNHSLARAARRESKPSEKIINTVIERQEMIDLIDEESLNPHADTFRVKKKTQGRLRHSKKQK